MMGNIYGSFYGSKQRDRSPSGRGASPGGYGSGEWDEHSLVDVRRGFPEDIKTLVWPYSNFLNCTDVMAV